MTIIKNKYFIITLILISVLIIGFGLMEIALSGGGGGGNGPGGDADGTPCAESIGDTAPGMGVASTATGNGIGQGQGGSDAPGGNGGNWNFPDAPPPPPPPPPTVDLWSWPIFEFPEPVSLRWSSTNADSCTASGDWSGNKQTQGREELVKPRGTYTFILTCTGPGGSASDSVTVRVIQVPQCTFTANPTTIIPPAFSTLSWECIYADSCSIDQGIGSVNNVSGTKDVRPPQTTTYTLTCDGLDGSRSLPATITVGFIPWIREVIPR